MIHHDDYYNRNFFLNSNLEREKEEEDIANILLWLLCIIALCNVSYFYLRVMCLTLWWGEWETSEHGWSREWTKSTFVQNELCKSVKHTERQTEVKGKKYGFLYSVYTYLITNLRMFEDAHLMSLFGCCALFATPHTEYHWAAISSLSLALDCRQYNKIYILHITYHTKKAGLFTLITSYHLFSLSLGPSSSWSCSLFT